MPENFCEFDILILLFFLLRYVAVIIKQPSGYSFGKKVEKNGK